MIRRTLGLLAVIIAAALVLAPLPAGAAGVAVYNGRLCGQSEWVRIKLPASEYTVHTAAGVCVNTPAQGRLGYTVDTNDGPHWTYPNISSGYEQGGSSCASARDACYRYPVQEKDDGTPVASVRAWLARGVYNLAFDVWFSPTSAVGTLNYQHRKGDTEVMVWLAHPGIRYACGYHVTIDHVSWCVQYGEAGGGSGQPWQRITYVAPRTALGSLSVSNLWLNPLFRDAIKHRMLTPAKWLYAIDLGFELYSGGAGSNIHYYSLSGVA
ncbi:MAG TPA: hypothetical protein VIL16_20865 [Trebonia sp.]